MSTIKGEVPVNIDVIVMSGTQQNYSIPSGKYARLTFINYYGTGAAINLGFGARGISSGVSDPFDVQDYLVTGSKTITFYSGGNGTVIIRTFNNPS